jgi:hypothetical protein
LCLTQTLETHGVARSDSLFTRNVSTHSFDVLKSNLRYAESEFEFTYSMECHFMYFMHESFHIPIKSFIF